MGIRDMASKHQQGLRREEGRRQSGGEETERRGGDREEGRRQSGGEETHGEDKRGEGGSKGDGEGEETRWDEGRRSGVKERSSRQQDMCRVPTPVLSILVLLSLSM